MTTEEQVILLTYMIATNDILLERFGPQTTLSELSAAFRAHREMSQGKDVTITRLSEMSGVSTSTLSAMVRRRKYIKTEAHPHDDRVKLLKFDDKAKRLKYLEEILESVRTAQVEPDFVKLEVGAEDFLKSSETE